jgi:predicted DNA-binding protein (MmcQ/YjbR family)
MPGYHMNKRHWNTIILDGSLPSGLLRSMIDHSHSLVVASLPRAKRPAGFSPVAGPGVDEACG